MLDLETHAVVCFALVLFGFLCWHLLIFLLSVVLFALLASISAARLQTNISMDHALGPGLVLDQDQAPTSRTPLLN